MKTVWKLQMAQRVKRLGPYYKTRQTFDALGQQSQPIELPIHKLNTWGVYITDTNIFLIYCTRPPFHSSI